MPLCVVAYITFGEEKKKVSTLISYILESSLEATLDAKVKSILTLLVKGGNSTSKTQCQKTCLSGLELSVKKVSYLPHMKTQYRNKVDVCVCVCVCERQRERE